MTNIEDLKQDRKYSYTFYLISGLCTKIDDVNRNSTMRSLYNKHFKSALSSSGFSRI